MYSLWLASPLALSDLYAHFFGRFGSIINPQDCKTASHLLRCIWGYVCFVAKLFLLNPVKVSVHRFSNEYLLCSTNKPSMMIPSQSSFCDFSLFQSVVGHCKPTHSRCQGRCGQYRIHYSFNTHMLILCLLWRVWTHFSVYILDIINENIPWWEMRHCTL